MASDTATPTGRTGPRTRPRDRKTQIINAAIVLFHRDGYHRVGMEHIAAAVDITAGALYRHFRNKQALLAEGMLAVIDEYRVVAEAHEGRLEDMVRALIRQVIERRDRGPLWQRFGRDLTEEHRAEVRDRLRSIATLVADAVAAARPDLTPADVDLVTWAALAVLASPFEYHTSLPAPRFEEVLTSATLAVCHTGLLPHATAPAGSPAARDGLLPTSRREVLLITAGRLFSESGFEAVTMEAIGAAAGISGPAVYNHFDSKHDLLAAVLDRGGQTLLVGLRHALAGAGTPDEALEPVVRSYLEPALRLDGLPGLLHSEVHHLGEQERESGRRTQCDYVDEWAALLPTSTTEGRVLVHAGIAVVNSLVLIPHLRSRPAFADEVAGLTLDVLRPAGHRD
jgi:AcrR family transcriptional regulator